MAGSGSVVTAAGLVFAFTMASFIFSDLLVLGQIGTTIALGLLFDTLIVRSFMTPSIAALLGRWFWWPVRVRNRPVPQKFGDEDTRQLSLFWRGAQDWLSMTSVTPALAGSTWAPLRSPVFRALWIAQFVSNLGTWMQTVGRAVDARRRSSRRGAGAVGADRDDAAGDAAGPAVGRARRSDRPATSADRDPGRRWPRRVALLASLTGAGLTTPTVLLTLLFLIGCGQALTAPAWQAIQPDLVAA